VHLPIEYIAEINEIDVEYVRDIVKNNTAKADGLIPISIILGCNI